MAKTQKEISKRYEGNRSYHNLLQGFRRWKFRMAWISFTLGVALVLVFALGFRRVPHLEGFYNVGRISRAHAQFGQNCQQCHLGGAAASIVPLKTSAKALQQGCEECHHGYNFHQANVVTQATCISCHHEHMGAGPMHPVTDSSCISCHGNASLMAASRDLVLKIPSRFLDHSMPSGVTYYPEPRMPDGYTKVIHAFDGDHPEFRIIDERMPDDTAGELDRLKFNHQIHMTGNIPMVDGHKLDCTYCHKLDATRTYMQPVSYEVGCQACHSLQFDASLPGLQIPHPTGNSDTAYNFLLTLPTQIERYGREQLMITNPNRLQDFVADKMTVLRERARRGDDLVHDVFFADNLRQTSGFAAGHPDTAPYPGCAYCHTVESSASGAPNVPRPLVPDRWMVHAKFDHSKHATMSCEQCHGAILNSTKNSEIALPNQASCVTCHSARGQVVSTCVTCHGFHHTAPPGLSTASADITPVRAMLLGQQ